jgi:hypothetical protein
VISSSIFRFALTSHLGESMWGVLDVFDVRDRLSVATRRVGQVGSGMNLV